MRLWWQHHAAGLEADADGERTWRGRRQRAVVEAAAVAEAELSVGEADTRYQQRIGAAGALPSGTGMP